MGGVDVPRPSKRQATSGVVAVGHNVVLRPLLSSPFCVGKIESFVSAFGIGQRFTLSSHVRGSQQVPSARFFVGSRTEPPRAMLLV